MPVVMLRPASNSNRSSPATTNLPMPIRSALNEGPPWVPRRMTRMSCAVCGPRCQGDPVRPSTARPPTRRWQRFPRNTPLIASTCRRRERRWGSSWMSLAAALMVRAAVQIRTGGQVGGGLTSAMSIVRDNPDPDNPDERQSRIDRMTEEFREARARRLANAALLHGAGQGGQVVVVQRDAQSRPTTAESIAAPGTSDQP